MTKPKKRDFVKVVEIVETVKTDEKCSLSILTSGSVLTFNDFNEPLASLLNI